MHVHRTMVKNSIEICSPLPLINAPTNMTVSVPEEHEYSNNWFRFFDVHHAKVTYMQKLHYSVSNVQTRLEYYLHRGSQISKRVLQEQRHN